jgi:NADH:ubiquinone oxidoreductase subunit 5 (subunit L)/multisubunit Na+/H+ antiporter MnhA subunit
MPVTALVTGLAVLAILGAPLFSAFYSKDGILAASWLASNSRSLHAHGAHWLLAWLPFWLGAATALLTSYYMTRWWVRIFLGQPGDHHVVDHAHDPWLRGRIVLVILALGCFQIVWTHHLDPFTAHAWLDDVILPKTEGLYATMPAINEAQLEHTRHAYHMKAMTLATWFLAIGASLAVAVWWLMPRLGRNLAGELRAVWPMSWWWTLTSKLWGIEWLYDRLTAVFGKGLGSVAAAADLGTAKRLSELEGKPDGQPTCPLGLPSLDGGIDLIGRTASGFGKLSSAFNTGRIGTYLGLTALAVALVLLLLV